MKRILAGILSLVLVLSLAACANRGENPAATVPEQTTNKVEKPMDHVPEPTENGTEPTDENMAQRVWDADEVAIESVPYSGLGTIDFKESAVLAFDEKGFDPVQMQLPEKLPIYVNPYPSSLEGPTYEITEELQKAMVEHLSRFLSLLYADYDGGQEEFLTDPERNVVNYVRGTTDIDASVNGISLLSDDYPLGTDVTREELLAHPLVQAAVADLGITDPEVTKSVEYDLDGKESTYTYQIAQKAEDPLQQLCNRQFAGITVKNRPNSQSVLVQLDQPMELTQTGGSPVLSYAEVLEKVAADYPGVDVTEAKVELRYNTTAQEGYFMPVYRVYVKDGDEAGQYGAQYRFIEVMLMELSAQ